MATPTIIHGDCIEEMRALPDNSVDSIVTDPPYGLGFMGKAWDDLPPGLDFAREALRVLKPGGHLLAFGGTRTWHRLAVAVEDAGFEIRDSIAWLYGSGFPKSLDVSKAIDKAAGAEREVVGKKAVTRILPTDTKWGEGLMAGNVKSGEVDITAPATPAAQQWQGWGTALKPAFEPVVVARKPLVGTVAANVLEYGTGALNIDASRIGETGAARKIAGEIRDRSVTAYGDGLNGGGGERNLPFGRFPANVILDESQAAALDEQSGTLKSGGGRRNSAKAEGVYGAYTGDEPTREFAANEGGASRFFYVAKAPKRERPVVDGTAHPTVKPLALMRYLVRLVTPEGGTVLEPFAGSGTTVEAALLEGFDVLAIEREADYLPLIEARIARATEAA